MVGQQSVAQAPVKVERRERPPKDVAPPCPAPMRPCLTPGCPELVDKGRCSKHTKRTADRGYGAAWQRTSKAARQAQPWCSLCYSPGDLTLDHTTGLVVCRSCHRSEAQGGVRKLDVRRRP